MNLFAKLVGMLLVAAPIACRAQEPTFAFSHVCDSAAAPLDPRWQLVLAVDFAEVGRRDQSSIWVCFEDQCDPVVMMQEQAPFVAEWDEVGDIELRTMNTILVFNDKMTNSRWQGAVRVRTFSRSDRDQIGFVETYLNSRSGVGIDTDCQPSSVIR